MIGRHLLLLPARMPLIELPRALEDYFAFAETEPTRRGRRFSITLPILNGERLERLQWWYHISAAQELLLDGQGLAALRAQATQRFCRHIERWLQINRQRLHGDDPIPRVSALPPTSAAAPPVSDTDPANATLQAALSADILPWPRERIVNG